MKIIILNPELFIQYKSKIGIMLHTEKDSSKVNFFTGQEHLKLNRNQIEMLSMEEIEDAILSDDHLRELAEDNNLVEIHHHYYADEFMEYYNQFN